MIIQTKLVVLYFWFEAIAIAASISIKDLCQWEGWGRVTVSAQESVSVGPGLSL